jgi:hypothetical protein
MSLPAIMKHLDVLSDAGSRATRPARIVACRLTADPMERAMKWLARYQRFWSGNLDRLAAVVKDDQWPPNQAPSAEPATTSPDRASPSRGVSRRGRRKALRPGPSRKK